MNHIGFCFAESLRGKIIFNISKRPMENEILKVPKPFLKHNKIERLSNGPYWVLLRRVPSGDKTFSRFQKDVLPILKQEVQKPFLKHKKMERL